jgi:predicted permease
LVLSQFIDLTFAEPLFDKLAATVSPLALFSVGLQLKFNGWKKLIPQMSLPCFIN